MPEISLEELQSGGLQEPQSNLPEGFVDRVIKAESSGDPNVVSKKGAMGLMQIMPATWKAYSSGDPFDPEENKKVGTQHLEYLWKKYQDPKMVAAAYNWGEGNLDKFGFDKIPEETRDYVKKVAGGAQQKEKRELDLSEVSSLDQPIPEKKQIGLEDVKEFMPATTEKGVGYLQDMKNAWASTGLRGGSFWSKVEVGLNEVLKEHTGIDVNKTIGIDSYKLGKFAENAEAAAKELDPQTLLGKISTLPTYLTAATGGSQIVGQGEEAYENLKDQGVDTKTASIAAANTVAMGALVMAVPLGKGFIGGATAGAATNIGAYLEDRVFMKNLLEGNYKELATQFQVTPKDLIESGVLGGVLGSLVGKMNASKKLANNPKAVESFKQLAALDPNAASSVVNKVDDIALKVKLNREVPAIAQEKISETPKERISESAQETSKPSTESVSAKINDDILALKSIMGDPLSGEYKTSMTGIGAKEGGAFNPWGKVTVYDSSDKPIMRDTTMAKAQDRANALGKTLEVENDKLILRDYGLGKSGFKQGGAITPFEPMTSKQTAAQQRARELKTQEVMNEWDNAGKPAGKKQLYVDLLEAKLGITPQAAKDLFDLREKQPIIYMNNGIPVTPENLKAAFTALSKWKPVKVVEKEVSNSYEWLQRNFDPAGRGKIGEHVEALTAKAIATRMSRDAKMLEMGRARAAYWDTQVDTRRQFIKDYEKGKTFSDPIKEEARQFYKEGYKYLNDMDKAKGIEYDARDNYILHAFESGDRAEAETWLRRKYGRQWGDPSFTHEREFEILSQAEKAGFKVIDHPEELFQSRAHSSSIAWMKIDLLNEMAENALARRVEKGMTMKPSEIEIRAPNGNLYFLGDEAAQLFTNAFNTESLWGDRSPIGSAFRGSMLLKNSIVPMKLMSGFHAVHVSGIHAMDSLASATENLIANWGNDKNALEFFKRATDPINPLKLYQDPHEGSRGLQIWKGKIKPDQMTENEKQMQGWMLEAGFVPELTREYKSVAIESLKRSIREHNYAAAAPKVYFAAVQSLMKPMMETWIPSLKYFSMEQNILRAIERDPSLLEDATKRAVTFNKLRKSVENRYGEMNYSTLFWNRFIRDLGVGSSLSLGWTLGFFREYGGAISDTSKAVRDIQAGKSIKTVAQEGTLHRPLYVLYYTLGSMAITGLASYAATGTYDGLIDLFYQKTGEKDENGKDKRVSNPSYNRELAALYFESRKNGVLKGVAKHFQNKVQPGLDALRPFYTDVDALGRAFVNQDDSWNKRLAQRLDYELQALAPIAVTSINQLGPTTTTRDKLFAVAGFGPMPKYAAETPIESQISATFEKYYGAKTTPYTVVQKSKQLKEAVASGDQEKLDKFQETYKLSDSQMAQAIAKAKMPSSEKLFQRLRSTDQLRILKQMNTQEVETYLPLASKKAREAFEGGEE